MPKTPKKWYYGLVKKKSSETAGKLFNFKFQRQKEKKIANMYTFTKIASIFLILLATVFVQWIVQSEYRATENNLEKNAIQTASNLRGRIQNSISEMRVLSSWLTDYTSTFDSGEVYTFLKNHINDYDYNKLAFAYLDGNTIRVQKNAGKLPSVNWLKDPRLVKAVMGEPSVTITQKDSTSPSGYVNEFGVPVYNKDGDVIGALGSQTYADKYINILRVNDYNKTALNYIISKDGNIIVSPPKDKSSAKNFFDKKIKLQKTTKDKILSNIKSKKTGTFIYKQGKAKYIATYSIIDSNEHYVLNVVPYDIIMHHMNNLIIGFFTVIVLISLLLLALYYFSSYILKQNEKIIYDIAFIDPVTEGNNRNKFLLVSKDLIEQNPDNNYAIISMDLTRFKAINELYGVENANGIIKDVYEIIKKNTGEDGFCARDYAASYIILYKYEDEKDILDGFINKMQKDIKEYNENHMSHIFDKKESHISAKLTLSFGIYPMTDKTLSVEMMCEKAQIAKRNLKDDAMNYYKFYDDAIRAQILQDKSIEAEMYSALNNDQFKMFLQPKFYLKDKKISGAEALVRWIHPTRGMIPPINFIPLFERNGFIIELDRCIWKQAFEFISKRQKEGKEVFPISVNVSRIHLNNDSFIDELKDLCDKYNVNPKYLELELTESACFNNEQRLMEVLDKLKEIGFTISMDDFGTGYSSLTMLRLLPVDILKLDRSFIKDTIGDNKGEAVVRCIIEMANKLNMTTVAEGIEFEEQAEFLKNMGCVIAQGFLYGKPVNSDIFDESYINLNVKE